MRVSRAIRIVQRAPIGLVPGAVAGVAIAAFAGWSQFARWISPPRKAPP